MFSITSSMSTAATSLSLDQQPHPESEGSWWEVQEAGSEESEGVGGRHDEGSVRIQK